MPRFDGAINKLGELPESFPELVGKKCLVQVGEHCYSGAVVSLSWAREEGLFRLQLAHAELAVCAGQAALVGDWLHEHRTNAVTQGYYSARSWGNPLSLMTGAQMIVVQSVNFVPR